MTKRLTLAEQLAEIAEPAPQDFDPEDSYTTFGHEQLEGEEGDGVKDKGRDFVDVGPSQLRRRAQTFEDPKYAGKRSSRKEMFGGDDGFEEEDSQGEDEDGSGRGSEDEEEDDDEEEEDDEELDSEEEDEDEDEEMATPPPPTKKVKASSSKVINGDLEEKAMVKQLKQAASADVEKGRDVKKQLAFCDNVLEARIKLQKATLAFNSLPQSSNSAEYFSLLPLELSETFAELQGLNEELFSFRQDLIKTNEKLEVPTSFGASRKRKRGGDDDIFYFEESIKDLQSLETLLEPFLRSTVTKWSDKVLAASGLSIGKDKKFKAVNQNTMSQIDHALSSSERERLIKRTRVNRAAGAGGKIVGKEEVTLEGEKKEVDEEIFDDGDFYQQLLRDIVESRMLDLDDPTLASLRLASARGKKTKKVVDTRASKGRKIRYHVHEKVQNFMVPIEANAWHDEQIDELFASLLGRSAVAVGVAPVPVESTKVKTNGAGSLRIFG